MYPTTTGKKDIIQLTRYQGRKSYQRGAQMVGWRGKR